MMHTCSWYFFMVDMLCFEIVITKDNGITTWELFQVSQFLYISLGLSKFSRVMVKDQLSSFTQKDQWLIFSPGFFNSLTDRKRFLSILPIIMLKVSSRAFQLFSVSFLSWS